MYLTCEFYRWYKLTSSLRVDNDKLCMTHCQLEQMQRASNTFYSPRHACLTDFNLLRLWHSVVQIAFSPAVSISPDVSHAGHAAA